MRNLITCLSVCVLSAATFADKAPRGSAYPLEDGQLIANNSNNLQRYNSPCTNAPWSSSPCGNWQHDVSMGANITYIAADSQGTVLIFDTGSGLATVYRYYGQNVCCEKLFQLPTLIEQQPTIIGNYIYYCGQSESYPALNKVDISTGEVEVIAEDFLGKHLATDGINLFTMQHVINGDCCWNCGDIRYSQIWTVDLETGDLESLVCNWRHSCGTVGDATDFTCSSGYFHIYHHGQLMLVDPSPVNSIAYAGEYCDENNIWSLSSMQTSGSYSPDLDCSGEVGVDDLLTLIGKWGGTFGPADLNKDGHVNVHDLLILIGDWA